MRRSATARPPSNVHDGIALFTRLLGCGGARAVDRPADRRPRTQGVGAAIATPLTLTLLADAFPPARRGVALGVWAGISGIAVALGPLVGGALIQLASWHWIFWLNVPIGAALVPLARPRLRESHGPTGALDCPASASARSACSGSSSA